MLKLKLKMQCTNGSLGGNNNSPVTKKNYNWNAKHESSKSDIFEEVD
jgi:hypothetical protein